MNVVVTGAAGFIGSHLCTRLLEEGHSVVGIDVLDDFYDPGRKRNNLKSLESHKEWRFHEGDIRDEQMLELALKGTDVVVHLAARAGVRPSFEHVTLYGDVNVRGTAAVLVAAHRCNVPRFIFGSSSSVYGLGAPTPFSEDAPLGVPQSPYASTKVAGEFLCHNLHSRFQSLTVLRFFTVYGPRQRPDLAIHKFALLMSRGESIPVFGPLDSFRDYTYVDDIVSGIVSSLRIDQPWAVLNLGRGTPVTLEEMIFGLEKALGIDAQLERLPKQEGDLDGTWADTSNARRMLGYDPQWSFEAGVDSFVEWFRASGLVEGR